MQLRNDMQMKENRFARGQALDILLKKSLEFFPHVISQKQTYRARGGRRWESNSAVIGKFSSAPRKEYDRD